VLYLSTDNNLHDCLEEIPDVDINNCDIVKDYKKLGKRKMVSDQSCLRDTLSMLFSLAMLSASRLEKPSYYVNQKAAVFVFHCSYPLFPVFLWLMIDTQQVFNRPSDDSVEA
jgi:hypothetical protein